MTTEPRFPMGRRGLAMAVALGAGLVATGASAQEDPRGLTVREAAAAIRDGQVTGVQLVDALARAAEAHADLNAFITLDVAAAQAAAPGAAHVAAQAAAHAASPAAHAAAQAAAHAASPAAHAAAHAAASHPDSIAMWASMTPFSS